MSAQDWYARRLAQVQQPQQLPPRGQPNAPGRPQQPQYPQAYQQPVYQPQPQPQQYQQPQQVVQFAGYQYEGAQNYQGGIAQQLNPDACPQCGGNQYFAKVRTKGRGPDPAGHCYNCGYNELFDQGDQASWGGGSPVVTTGDVQLAGIQVTASPWAAGVAPAE
jgi:predicted nucleic-acid-binding Zn-ribbon protein